MSHVPQREEHGTLQSYVIGFVLSLIFTFIPYYLVVNQSIKGTSLLVTIIGFAVIQMIIQITFFLHLGRGPKPNWNLFFFISTVGIILIVVGGSILIINNLRSYHITSTEKTTKLVNGESIYQIGGELTGACQQLYDNHKIMIKYGQVSPLYVEASKCDTLTFVNEDDVVLEITFGPHPEHGVYAGEYELIVKKGRTKTITLSETGTYRFHDHLRPEISGAFTVNDSE